MAKARSTAPPGYPSNYRAILDLIRFGFALWGPIRMAVLLFHVERSTAYGWQSDQHSQSQSQEGIYSKSRREWIRAPAGISPAAWKRANVEFIAAGLIVRERRKTKRNGDAASEYAPDWGRIQKQIEDWKTANAEPETTPLFAPPGPVPVAPTEPGGGSHRARGVAPTEPGGWLPQSHTVVNKDVALNSGWVDEASAGAGGPDEPPTHRESGIAELRSAIESAYGAALQPNDTIPGEILAIGERIGIPARALCYWVQDWAREKRDRAYPITSPRLFVQAAGTNLIPWARANQRCIDACRRMEASEIDRATCQRGQLLAMPQPDAASTPETASDIPLSTGKPDACDDSSNHEERPAADATPNPAGEITAHPCPVCAQEMTDGKTCTNETCIRLRARVAMPGRRRTQAGNR